MEGNKPRVTCFLVVCLSHVSRLPDCPSLGPTWDGHGPYYQEGIFLVLTDQFKSVVYLNINWFCKFVIHNGCTPLSNFAEPF
jgi:hypothetical protein